MMNDEGYPSLGNTVDSFPRYDFDSWWISKPWVDKHETTLVKFLKAFIKAQRWVDDPKNKEEATVLIEKEVQISKDYARRSYVENIEKYKIFEKDANPDTKGLEAMISVLSELGEFKDIPALPICAFQDEKYLQRAHKELGIK